MFEQCREATTSGRSLLTAHFARADAATAATTEEVQRATSHPATDKKEAGAAIRYFTYLY